VVRVKGLLNAPGRIGETVTIRTPVGRLLTGILEVVQPADTHTFGRPHPALVEAVDNIRDLLEDLA
jgi:hypothetical protein